MGSLIVVHRLSCSVSCGVFLYQGLNLCPLHCWAGSYPLCHQGSPTVQWLLCVCVCVCVFQQNFTKIVARFGTHTVFYGPVP